MAAEMLWRAIQIIGAALCFAIAITQMGGVVFLLALIVTWGLRRTSEFPVRRGVCGSFGHTTNAISTSRIIAASPSPSHCFRNRALLLPAKAGRRQER
jgi:hypothetical protein